MKETTERLKRNDDVTLTKQQKDDDMNFREALDSLYAGKSVRRNDSCLYLKLNQNERICSYGTDNNELVSAHWTPFEDDLYSCEWNIYIPKWTLCEVAGWCKSGYLIKREGWPEGKAIFVEDNRVVFYEDREELTGSLKLRWLFSNDWIVLNPETWEPVDIGAVNEMDDD